MKNYVFGHINPDTDSNVCAIAYADFLSRDGVIYTPARFSDMDAESEYLLTRAGVDFPVLVTDFSDADKIVLVDTHHKLQLPENFPYERVTQIIDHHPNGDVNLFPNAVIENQVVGATASLIAKKYMDADIWDSGMLQLLAMAIVSDTLNFKLSTTTDFDREMFDIINKKYPISENQISGMIYSRGRLLERGLNAVIAADVKLYDTNVGRVAISQVQVPGIIAVLDSVRAKTAMLQVAESMGLDYFILNASDLYTEQSLVIGANTETVRFLVDYFNLPFQDGVQMFDRILLRKKDFIFDKKEA